MRAGFFTTGFFVALTMVVLGLGIDVTAKAVGVDKIIAPATIDESTRPLIREPI